MKKIYELGAKTGLNSGELSKVARFGLFGLVAAALTCLTGCFKTAKPAPPAPEPTPRASAQTEPSNIQDLVNSIEKSTAAAKPGSEENCGPYPGYPCGTKYYTVSVSDFKKTC